MWISQCESIPQAIDVICMDLGEVSDIQTGLEKGFLFFPSPPQTQQHV